ncbi:MAG TPA: hypothetical protein VLU25_19330 [Acidobacteriota bacterium]|nr:hypothetical protein [Acidobacteriota bacterium]
MASKGWFSFWESKILLVFIVASLGLNVAYYLKVQDLSQALRNRTLQETPILQVGDWVPDLRARHLDETVSSIGFAQPTMLMVFSKDCQVCQANFSNWTDLENQIGAENVLYVATNPLQATRDYARQRRIEDRTVLFAELSQRDRAYHIHRVPQTILIDGSQVKAIETGVLSAEKKERLMEAWSKAAPAPQQTASQDG